MRRAAVLLLVLVVAGAAAGTAGAQAPPVCADAPSDFEPPLPNDSAIETRELRQDVAADCAALLDRLDSLIALQEAAVESETTTSAQRVALAPVDRNRLDLMWWGAWATVGMMFVLLAAPMFLRAFRFWQA